MKTVQDLIDMLNVTIEDEGVYYLTEKHKGIFAVDYKLMSESWSIAIFDKPNKTILLTTNKNIMNWKEMYWISKYALEHPYEDWFAEKKYNIIIGEDVNSNNVVHRNTCYEKTPKGVDVNDSVREEYLTLDRYIFTESEIEDLKSKVSEQSAKIIDLGKVEVKDD